MRLNPRCEFSFAAGAIAILALLAVSSPVGAVTARNVKCKGCISGKEIKKNAVRGKHVKNKAVTSKKLRKSAVTGSRIKDREVTVAKLSSDAAAAIAGRNVVHNVVRVTRGDSEAPASEAAGGAIIDAVNAITDAAGNNRYLVQIGPGTWNVGGAVLEMKPFVDIEGAGQGVTRITGSVVDAAANAGVIEGADHAELRYLTVENTADYLTNQNWPSAILNHGVAARIRYVTAIVSGEHAIGIHNFDSDDVRLQRVTVTASNVGGTRGTVNDASSVAMRGVSVDSTGNFAIGIHNIDSNVVVNGGQVKASGPVGAKGFHNDGTDLTMTNLRIDVDGSTPHCMDNRASTVVVNNVQGTAPSSSARCITTRLGGTTWIHNSRISGVAFSLATDVGSATRVTNSRLFPAPWQSGADDKCFNSVGENFELLGANCLPDP